MKKVKGWRQQAMKNEMKFDSSHLNQAEKVLVERYAAGARSKEDLSAL